MQPALCWKIDWRQTRKRKTIYTPNYMDYGAETIRRQTRDAYGFLVIGQNLWAHA